MLNMFHHVYRKQNDVAEVQEVRYPLELRDYDDNRRLK